MLSAQATDAGVNKATKTLFAEADTPDAMLALGEDGVRRHIRTIGLFNAKARNVIGLSRILVEEHGGRRAREPGGAGTPARRRPQDGQCRPQHGFRPADHRGGHTYLPRRQPHRLAPGKTPLDVEKKLERRVPAHRKLHAHHWLILHGRYVCRARKPDCPACTVADLCGFKGKTTI